jgi:hypothetical protein
MLPQLLQSLLSELVKRAIICYVLEHRLAVQRCVPHVAFLRHVCNYYHGALRV